ncbi:MAG: hypothetical protein ABIK92_14455 [Pseudomonadota bacterium]
MDNNDSLTFICVHRTFELSGYDVLFAKFEERNIPFYYSKKETNIADSRIGPSYRINNWYNFYVPNQYTSEAIEMIKEYVDKRGLPSDVFESGEKRNLVENLENILFCVLIAVLMYIVIIIPLYH